MRVCRIASYPTASRPGTGLPGYYLSRAIRVPTLFLTRKVDGLLPAPPHVTLRPIPYASPAFGERIDPATASLKALGLARFLIASIPPMVSFRPTIVHIHSPLYLAHAIFARLFLRSKICMTFHGSDLLRVRRSRLLGWLLRRAVDCAFYVSAPMRTDLAAIFPAERLVYTPNGVDTRRFRNMRRRREKLVVAVGNLRWQKGYAHLVDAFARLGRTDYRLVIVGEGPLRLELEERIRTMRLDEWITLAGRKNHEEIVRLLNRAAIYVMPSVSEGFPKALLEALACGCPAVATDVGSCREVVAGAGLCVPPGDVEALAGALGALMGNEGLRSALARGAEMTAAKYSWNIPCAIAAARYDELSNGPDRPCLSPLDVPSSPYVDFSDSLGPEITG